MIFFLFFFFNFSTARYLIICKGVRMLPYPPPPFILDPPMVRTYLHDIKEANLCEILLSKLNSSLVHIVFLFLISTILLFICLWYVCYVFYIIVIDDISMHYLSLNSVFQFVMSIINVTNNSFEISVFCMRSKYDSFMHYLSI